MALTIRQGKVADALSLAPRLRPIDALEVLSVGHPDVLTGVIDSVLDSYECYAVEEAGAVIGLWGIASEGTAGIPWFLGSEESLRYPKQLLKQGRLFVERWARNHTVLANFSHPSNTAHHRWITRIGFTFNPSTEQGGAFKTPLRYFYRFSQCAASL